MKCPKCKESALLCKRPIFHIHETGRLHFARQAVELGKKIDVVPGDEDNAIYFCEECGFSGTGKEMFQQFVVSHEEVEKGDEDTPTKTV